MSVSLKRIRRKNRLLNFILKFMPIVILLLLIFNHQSKFFTILSLIVLMIVIVVGWFVSDHEKIGVLIFDNNELLIDEKHFVINEMTKLNIFVSRPLSSIDVTVIIFQIWAFGVGSYIEFECRDGSKYRFDFYLSTKKEKSDLISFIKSVYLRKFPHVQVKTTYW